VGGSGQHEQIGFLDPPASVCSTLENWQGWIAALAVAEPRFSMRSRAMSSDVEIGWIAAIIIGGLAGWLAEMFMQSGTGILMNIILGIVGAAIASAILSAFGIVLGGWIGYLILGFIGACILIWIARVVRGRPAS